MRKSLAAMFIAPATLILSMAGCRGKGATLGAATTVSDHRNVDTATIATADSEKTDSDPRALTDFRSELDAYGTWKDDPNLGTVWTPSAAVVGPGFSPYVTDGHWASDGRDLVWISAFPWGWGPFHFGRWVQVGATWGWIPGRVYAGAWVNWRIGPSGFEFIGWAPRPPSWGFRGGQPFKFPGPLPSAYVFTRIVDLFYPAVGGRVVASREVNAIAAKTTPVQAHRDQEGFLIRGPSLDALGLQAAAPPAANNEPSLLRALQFAGDVARNELSGEPLKPTGH